jgi:hypothetical protein
MLYDTIKNIGSYINALSLAYFMARKAWNAPTSHGLKNFKERAIDAFAGAVFQLGCSAYFELYKELACSTKWVMGTFERLYKVEKNPEVKKLFVKYVKDFT